MHTACTLLKISAPRKSVKSRFDTKLPHIFSPIIAAQKNRLHVMGYRCNITSLYLGNNTCGSMRK